VGGDGTYKFLGRELGALIGIHDVRCSVFSDLLLQRLYAEVRLKRIR
jgi:hypothetical protein